MKIEYDREIDAAVDFEEHNEIAGYKILDVSDYPGFSPEHPKIEVKAFEKEKV